MPVAGIGTNFKIPTRHQTHAVQPSGHNYTNLVSGASQAFEHFLLVRFIAANDDDAELLLVFRVRRVLDAVGRGLAQQPADLVH